MQNYNDYEELVKEFGEQQAQLILLYGMQHKGKLDEIKRAKILGTLRTGENSGRSIRDGNKISKTVSTDSTPSR